MSTTTQIPNEIDYEALRAEQAAQCPTLTGLELQRLDFENVSLSAISGQSGQSEEIIAHCKDQYSPDTLNVKDEFSGASADNSAIATLACTVGAPAPGQLS